MSARYLPFLSHNESQTETIVLLHGAFSSYHAFDIILSQLSHYHLLIPDHTTATQHQNFDIGALVEAVVQLIQSHAKGQRAHLVGHSFGAHLALRVAGRCPEQILDVFASGVNRLPGSGDRGSWFDSALPYLVLAVESIGHTIPRTIRDNVLGGRFAPVKGAKAPSLQQVRNLLAAISKDNKFPTVQCPTVLLVASKAAWPLEEPDSVQDARSVLDEIHADAGRRSRFVSHPHLTHSWIETHPELFAETVLAVAAGGQLHPSFMDITMEG